MNAHVRQFEEAAEGQLQNITTSWDVIGRKMTSMFDDTLNYSKQTFEEAAALAKHLSEKPSLLDALRLQTEFARGQGLAFVEQCRKAAGIYQEIANEAIRPVKSAVANFSAVATR